MVISEMNPDAKSRNLRLLRRALRMTQQQFMEQFLSGPSGKSAMSIATYSNLERKGGKRLNEVISKVSRQLNLDPMVFTIDPGQFSEQVEHMIASAPEKQVGAESGAGDITELVNRLTVYFADDIISGRLKKGSRILLEGLPIPTAEDVAAMLDYADPALRAQGFAPYYLYRQKYMSGSFENVGWCISGAEGLYNIYIMEELHSILSLGAGGSTKMVDAGRNRIERVFHPKFPLEYIQRPEKLTENLEAFRRFHENMAR